jgi:molybdopterin-guanine dinucleotide biosynthesis protein A
LGAVLAGGRSSRFGSDKALALLDGRQLIEHAVAALSPHVAQVAICGRNDPRWLCLADEPAPDMGPLGGLAAALSHARQGGFRGVLSTGCDIPVMPASLVTALVGDGAAVVEGHHLIGYWPAHLADRLLEHLGQQSGNRSIRGWIAVVEPRVIAPPDGPLPNINRPADLAAWSNRI